MIKIYLLGRFILIFGSLLLFSCEREIQLRPRNEKPNLVIEGTITNLPPPYSVLLSYSGPYSRADTIASGLYINDATVTIEDNFGNSTTCINKGQGVYQTMDSSFIGVIGRTYKVRVGLSDGKVYISTGETMQPNVPVDKVNVSVDNSFTASRPTRFVISVDVNDPGNNRNYYHWKATSLAPRKATGTPCGLFCLLGEYCLQEFRPEHTYILSDQLINGNRIFNQEVIYSPIYWFGKHFIEVRQYSITRSAYLFWEKYKEQVSRSGSISDPLPAPLEGNVSNMVNPSDVALGYFAASSVTVKRVTVVPFYLREYLLRSMAGGFIGQGDCSVLYPKAFYNYNDPPGWAGSEVIEIH